MAELGAFWGAGRQVLIFLADPEIDEDRLPAQFRGNLWTTDARRIVESLHALVDTAANDILTPDLVLLLRYLERDNRWTLPDAYGMSLAVANGVPTDIDEAALRGWKRAVRYGLLYLAHHGMAEKQADTSVTYTISAQGKAILNSAHVRQRFNESFEKELIA
jgi:hypothetical protein